MTNQPKIFIYKSNLPRPKGLYGWFRGGKVVNRKDPLFQVHVYLRESQLRKIERFKNALYEKTGVKISNSEAIRWFIDIVFEGNKGESKKSNEEVNEESTNG